MITIDNLKQFAKIDYNDDDNQLEILMNSAISIVERYTNLSLESRTLVFTYNESPIRIFLLPVESIDGSDKVCYKSDYTEIIAKKGDIITVNLGQNYDANLEYAVYRLATSLYENVEIDSMNLPLDVQGILNQYRRTSFLI